MALPQPREGESLGFSSRSGEFDETTIGDPEHYLWTSIRHWGVNEYADNALEDIHNVTDKRSRKAIVQNLKLYIDQSYELYQAASGTKANTAPLMFWLGSLVRYDPHSVADLQDSEYWLLIDGFMTQSRLWLLELFEWELYQSDIVLRSAR